MVQQSILQNNRWSNTSTVVPTRPASYADPEKAFSPLQEAQADVPAHTAESDPSKSEAQSSHERPKTLDWDGPDDPLNPHQWSLVRRWFQTYTISGVALVGTFASSVFTPSIEPTAAEFGSPTIIATLAFSIYQLGLAFGGPFAAPLSESFGRRPVVFISLPIFALFILGTGFAQNMATLVVLRFFAGLFAAPSLSMGSGTLSDLWQPEKRSGPMSMYVAAPFFGPALGPLLGAAVTQNLSWRWTSWLILFFTIVLIIIPAPFYWESYKPVLLRQRAKKNGLPVPPSALEGVTWAKALKTYVSKTLTRPMHMLLTEPIVAAFNAYSAFNFGLLYAFFAAFPQVYLEYYGFDSLSTGLTFLGVGVGVLVATIAIMLFSKKWYLPHVREAVANSEPAPSFATSRLEPEKRLPLAMIGGPCLTIGLFM
ncbi:hypothetical protein N0V94_003640 [Neodidymelliopsis sp. IMI 364377]|nr:hypothetical protein N0V94_003640 [Neodidymelliopsis sp. IMI 364377]